MEVQPAHLRRFRAFAVSAVIVACGGMKHEPTLARRAPAASPPSPPPTQQVPASAVPTAPPAPLPDTGAAAMPTWPCGAPVAAPPWAPSKATAPDGKPFTRLFVAKVGEHDDAVRGITFVGPQHLVSIGDDRAV